MKEYTFICPHCGKAVEVDENGYAAIIKQLTELVPAAKRKASRLAELREE